MYMLLLFPFTGSNHLLLHVKIYGDPSEATGETIEVMKTKLAEWIPMKKEYIKFKQLKEGSIELIFELPDTVETTLRAKAAEQNADWLANVISIAIGDEPPIYVNSAQKDHNGK